MESATTMATKISSSPFFAVSVNPKPKSGTLLRFHYNHGNNVSKSVKCVRQTTPNPDSSNLSFNRPSLRNPSSSFPCWAVTSPFPPRTYELASCKLERLVNEFQLLVEPIERVKRLLHYAGLLPVLDDSSRIRENRVMGCTAQVWLDAEMDEEGRMRFVADSDSEITRGFCACLVWVFDGAMPDEVLKVKTEDLAALNVGMLGSAQSRVNTWHNVLISMQKRTKAFVAEREGKQKFEPFPSLIVSADGIRAKGSYAEAQARFLFPDQMKVEELVNVLKERKIGVAAHFYMDPEVQGVLTAAQKDWPQIHISDSLIMADSAVKMAEAGCKFIAVLGVDFMSENVRAILDQAGYHDVGVYRMSNESIGCSLADAASNPSYMNYLRTASVSPPSLHVIYINTSLETKAHAHELVPTITCTSSNVVQTILQAFAEIPNLNILYGPDSYMGANIAELFQQMVNMTDEEIAEIHPEHSKDSIRSLLSHLQYYQEEFLEFYVAYIKDMLTSIPLSSLHGEVFLGRGMWFTVIPHFGHAHPIATDGTCMVHHLFGHEVVERINEMYCDAFLTAHLEVPGEMFSMAMEAKKRGMGVVGSTQSILDFIKQKVQEALHRNLNEHLQFVLGTESGMITSIVAVLRDLLGFKKDSLEKSNVTVEIVFPVSSESMTRSSTNSTPGLSSVSLGGFDLPVIPGVASGEGCSIHGGCASCPYMKMNSLTALLKVCHNLPDNKGIISAYKAARFDMQTPQGNSVADIGCEPILHMRHFQSTKKLPEKLVNQILHPQRNGGSIP